MVVSHDYRFTDTLTQRAWPTNASGSYHSPKAEPLVFASVLDPTRHRRLPWTREFNRLSSRQGFADNPLKALLGLSELPLVFMAIGTFVYWSFQGRWRRVFIYLVAFVGVVLVTGALMLNADSRWMESDERYIWDGWYWILYVGSIGMGVLTVAAGIVVLLVKLFRRIVRGARTAS